MWLILIVRRSSCTWLVNTNNILINDELCMYALLKEKGRKKKKRKEKTETKGRMNGWRSRPSQRSVPSTEYVWTVVCTVRILPPYTVYTAWSDCSTRRPTVKSYENFRLDEIDDHCRLTTDMMRLDLGVRFNRLTNSAKFIIRYKCTYQSTLYVQPASRSANHVGWNDRIILITLSNNADSPRSQ